MHTLSSLRAGNLAGMKRIDLSCGLTRFPEEIFELADTLEILNLSGNALASLHDELPRLRNLRVIFCSDNQFTEVPEVLGRCQNLEMIGFKANRISSMPASSVPEKLRWLILTENKLAELPAKLGACINLQKLMLSGNELQSLPQGMSACTKLELLRIAANRFDRLPDWLFALPRLAWLACAGNPCSEAVELEAIKKQTVKLVEWRNVELQQRLGEGASGVIYRAKLTTEHDCSAVAVKMFKGTLTSDGFPRNEKAASFTAGSHPGLIPVLGKISGHPDAAPGLVMSLINDNFVNLAGPPSLESCTHDIYPATTEFTLPVALNIALKIAEAVEHLHARGVMHGDLYAHNILRNEQGDCLLGDFGAASLLPQQDEQLATTMQRIEVRAYACLLEELIERCAAPLEALPILDTLRQLHSHCNQPKVQDRPLFAEIRCALESLYD